MDLSISNNVKKKVFHAFAGILVENMEETKLTSENFAKAVTMNENLKSLGYTLNPNDIIKISKLKQFQNGELYIDKLIKEFEPSIKAKPMYPDFPKQVMELDKATLKLHQLIHYLSFAINEINEENDIKAWLPDVEETEKTQKDEKLLNAKVISIISIEELKELLCKCINKRERWTLYETEVIKEFLYLLDKDKFNIGFKENLTKLVYNTMIAENNTIKAKEMMLKMAKNPNDVLDCLEYILNEEDN